MLGLKVVIDANADTTHCDIPSQSRKMPARTRKPLPPDDADAIEQAVERYVEPLWEQWHAQYGIHGAAVERDGSGWVLILEVMPGTLAASTAVIPAAISVPLPGSVAPIRIRTSVIERK